MEGRKHIEFSAILHIPQSQYAFVKSNGNLCIRIRSKKNDITKCTLYYADRVDETSPIHFYSSVMKEKWQDEFYNYYETEIVADFCRICYYFHLEKEDDWCYFFADKFTVTLPSPSMLNSTEDGRSEYYQFPFILKQEIIKPPAWFMNANVYNIFPDSFANKTRELHETNQIHLLENGRTSENRLGGTIQGITMNLDYIQDLGFDCLYLNPIFVAGEYHKYDTMDYYHIDPCFGTDAEFRDLVKHIHNRGMKIIIDGVFNHCSWYFFAFDDVVKNGKESRFCNWFYDLNFPVIRPSKDDDLTYMCFAYVPNMPKLDTSNQEVQQYFADVGSYWIREFEVDGWRLDVANEVCCEFWRYFSKSVRDANPEAVLIGEVWENAHIWLKGDMFDSAMNYEFRRICKEYIATKQINAKQAAYQFESMWLRYPTQVSRAQLNLIDTHDVPRFLSLCNNDIDRWSLGCVLLLTMPGVPSMFYGDEQLITGVKEYDYRRKMQWSKDANVCELIVQLHYIRKTYINSESECQFLWEYFDDDIFAFRRNGKHTVSVYIDVNNKKNISSLILENRKANEELLDKIVGNNFFISVV